MPSGMAFASVMVQSAIAQSLVVPSRCIRHRSADLTSGVFCWRKLNMTQWGMKFRQQQKQWLVCVVMHQLRPQVVLSVDQNFIPLIMTPQSWTLLIWLLSLFNNMWGWIIGRMCLLLGVCKSWKDATNQYRLKIGVELMEGGDGRKLNVSEFLSYLDQEKFQLAKTIYVPCGKADKLLYCDVKAKCPRMRLLIHRQCLMMNGNTKFVVEGQSNHPCYRMYKHDCPYIDGINVWIRWLWDRKYKLVLERQFGTDNTLCKRMRTKTTFYRC